MPYDFITQGVGILGFLLGITAYLTKDDKYLKALIGCASFMMAAHFLLLGAYVGAGAAALSGFRSLISIFKSAKPYAPVFFLIYLPLGFFYIYDGLDVLPIIAGIIGTYSMFYLEKVPMRYGLFVTTFVWLIHNLLQGSIGGTLLELFYLGANVLTIRKMRKSEQDVIFPL